jgi:beta-1,4-mannosyl-glycoprotein beta-1,4-N-acetylglucosaminyltransferase
LDEYVDYFVLCEADVTHSGIPKNYIFEENKERFSKFLHKIIHVKINDIPKDFTDIPTIDEPKSFDELCLKDIYQFIRDTKLFIPDIHPHYGRDFFQKESVRRGLVSCSDDDIIILSDCDEIPNPEVLLKVDKFIDTEPFFTLQQTTYYYHLNLLKEHNWRGSRISRYKNIKHYSFNELRAQRNCEVSKGGWHFSFMGGREQVKNKIKAYSHQELNNPDILNKIDYNVENNIDPFSRSNLELVPIDESYPKYLLDNIEKYKHMIKTKHKPTLYTNVGITNEFDEFDRPVSIFVERYNEEELKTNNVNIWMDGCEPPELSHGWFNPHDVINNYEKFDLILTRDPQILENCDNAYVFHSGE